MRKEVEELLKRPLIETTELARAIDWSPRRVRETLKGMGAATKVNGRWFTTRARLLVHWPELLQALDATDDDE